MTAPSPEELAARKRAAAAPRRATEADAAAVARSLARSFADDPVVTYFVRDDAGRPRAMQAWFDFAVRRYGLRGNELWMSEDARAVALWLPPPQDVMNMSALEELSLVPLLLNVVGVSRLARLNRLRAAVGAHHPTAPHAYLFFLGVDPDCQGQGLGSAILGATLAPLDASGTDAYLESSNIKNVPLYQRHGFEITSEFRPEPSGPQIWGMWRKAR